MLRRQPRPTLFPYTTLFRSTDARQSRSGHLVRRRFRRAPGIRRLACARAHARAPGDTGIPARLALGGGDRKSTRLNSSHVRISYAVFCLKKKKKKQNNTL